jgi:hypothetical protein
MKKGLVFVFLFLLVGAIYLLIPSRIQVARIMGSKCSLTGANRFFSDTSRWVQWWPRDSGGVLRQGPAFIYRGFAYTVTGIFYDRVSVMVRSAKGNGVEGDFRIAQISADSMVIGGDYTLTSGYNPLKRIFAYRNSKRLTGNVEQVLRAFKVFTESGTNIYGLDIQRAMSDDSILTTLSGFTPTYPSTGFIYNLIDSVTRYVGSQAAKVHNAPWLNVAPAPNGGFRTMVALSVDRALSGTPSILVKRFVPWKMIEGNVRGGPHTADKAMEQLYRYRDDYRLDIMSIPFQSLITDRRSEPDTTKWVTRVCAPVS